jgi:hypothetical protein
MTGLMTDPEHDDSFGWHGDDEPAEPATPSRDLRRVGVVVGISLIVLVALFALLLQVLSNVFGDMWDSVFTF